MRKRTSWRLGLWLFVLLVAAGWIGYWRWLEWRDHRHDRVILAAAARYGADPALVKAVVWQESRFNETARGTSGEIGLMQVGKLAAQEWAEAEGRRDFNHAQLSDPALNTLAGTWYLQKLLRRYEHTDNPELYALADYNAGRANVLRWNKGAASTNSFFFLHQMDFPGTRRYAQSVIERCEFYRPVFPRRGASPRD